MRETRETRETRCTFQMLLELEMLGGNAERYPDKTGKPLAEGVKDCGSSLFSVGTFPLAPERAGCHPQIAQISADVFLGFTPPLVLRNLRLVTQSCQSFA